MLDDLIDSLGLAEFLDSQDVSRVEKRLVRVELMLEALLAHHGIDFRQEMLGAVTPTTLSPEESAEVLDLVERGEKSAAIVRYREVTGVSEDEARAVIDRLQSTP